MKVVLLDHAAVEEEEKIDQSHEVNEEEAVQGGGENGDEDEENEKEREKLSCALSAASFRYDNYEDEDEENKEERRNFLGLSASFQLLAAAAWASGQGSARESQ